MYIMKFVSNNINSDFDIKIGINYNHELCNESNAHYMFYGEDLIQKNGLCGHPHLVPCCHP